MALTLNTDPPVDSTEQRRPVSRPALVHQPADRAADRVIDAGHAAGADGDEFLLRHGRHRKRRQRHQRRRCQAQIHSSKLHLHVPPFFMISTAKSEPEQRAAAAIQARPSYLPTAASMASPSRSTMVSIAPLSMMNGGASSTWSPLRAVHRSAHRINHQPARHRFALDPRMQFALRIERVPWCRGRPRVSRP